MARNLSGAFQKSACSCSGCDSEYEDDEGPDLGGDDDDEKGEEGDDGGED